MPRSANRKKRFNGMNKVVTFDRSVSVDDFVVNEAATVII